MIISAILSTIALGSDGLATPSGIVMIGRSPSKAIVIRHYSITGDKILSVKLRSEVPGMLIPAGFQGNYFPSPHGNGVMVWASNLDGSEHLVALWNLDPLKAIRMTRFKEVVQARWLFGRRAVSVIEWTPSGPQGWVLDMRSGRSFGPMKNVIALIDRPGSNRLLRVSNHSKDHQGHNLPSLQARGGFTSALSSGTLTFEESENLSRWVAITPMTAANNYVSSSSRSAKDCIIFTSWSSSNTYTLGFRDNWVTRSQNLIPPEKNPTMHEFGTIVDSLSSGFKVRSTFKRPARRDGATFLSMMPKGEVVYTLPLDTDPDELKYYERVHASLALSSKNDSTLLAMRLHKGKSRKWIATGLPRQWWGFFVWKP